MILNFYMRHVHKKLTILYVSIFSTSLFVQEVFFITNNYLLEMIEEIILAIIFSIYTPWFHNIQVSKGLAFGKFIQLSPLV